MATKGEYQKSCKATKGKVDAKCAIENIVPKELCIAKSKGGEKINEEKGCERLWHFRPAN